MSLREADAARVTPSKSNRATPTGQAVNLADRLNSTPGGCFPPGVRYFRRRHPGGTGPRMVTYVKPAVSYQAGAR